MEKKKAGNFIVPAASEFSMRKAREMRETSDKINFQYAGAKTTRFRDFLGYKGSETESQLLPYYDRLTIITRLRQLVRDDPYCASLLTAYATQMGTSTMSSVAGEDDDAAFNDRHERLWYEYAKRVEYTGLSLSEVEAILWREDLISGELFFLKLKNGRLQMIPSEFCFSDYANILPDSPEADGVVVKDGLVTGYRFGYRDKYGTLQPGKEITPAENVIHFFFQDRPEQRRGVPRLSSVLNVLQDIYEICNAKVNQVKTQSFISGVVTKNYAPADTADMMRLTNSDGTRSDYQDLRGGTLYYMETGEDMKPFQSSINATDFDDFLKSRLEAVGGAIGMPPECWIEGFRDSNYSSARATVSTWVRTAAARRGHCVARFLEPVHDFFLDKRPGEFPDKDEAEEVIFTFPAVPAIDEGKQNESDAKALAACLTSYQRVYGSRGQFWDTEFKQIAREKQRMETLDIAPNFAPNATAGTPSKSQQAKQQEDAAKEAKEEEMRHKETIIALSANRPIVPPPHQITVMPPNVTVSPSTVNVPAPVVNFEMKPSTINVEPAQVNFTNATPTVNVAAAEVNVPAPVVNVAAGAAPVVNFEAPAPVVNVTTPAPVVNVTVPPLNARVTFDKDRTGKISGADIKDA